MASSDEEGEIVPNCITTYHFVHRNGEPVSFSILPLHWGEDDILALNAEIFLHGTTDDGLQLICKKVLAWRFDLSYALPEIHVLSKDKFWIKLLKPRKSYADTIRTILITVHFLHFVKKNPNTFGEIVWNYIGKSLSAYEVLPSKDDPLEHMPIIKEAARRDKDLSCSKSFNAFLLETSQKRIPGYEMKMKMNNLIMFVLFVMTGENFCVVKASAYDLSIQPWNLDLNLFVNRFLTEITKLSRPSCAKIANINDINVLLVACWGLLTNQLAQRSSRAFLQLVDTSFILNASQSYFIRLINIEP